LSEALPIQVFKILRLALQKKITLCAVLMIQLLNYGIEMGLKILRRYFLHYAVVL